MRRIVFLGLFVIAIIGSVYGQTRSENRWLLGRWVAENGVELTLNDNGTGIFTDGKIWADFSGDIIFSINGNTLTVFRISGSSLLSETIYRINDQRIIIRGNVFNKRN